MDPNRPTEQQQPQSHMEEQRRRQPQVASSMNGAESSGSHSGAFTPFPEPGTTRNDVAQSSVPAPARRVTSFDQEYDVETRLTSPQSLTTISSQRVATPDRHYTANTSTSPYDVTPLPPAMVSSRSIILTDNNANRTLQNPYNHPGFTDVPPTRESRGTPPGPDQLLERSSTMMHTGTGTETVSVEEKPTRCEKTVAERLGPTLLNATIQKTKYAKKARWTAYALNTAIGLQVLLGSLTTALSVVTKGSQTAVMTAILGGFSTIVASYLARARGSNEPELSIARVKDLDQFIRECDAFTLDNGHAMGDKKFDEEVESFRRRFEALLGNANGERKLSV